MLTFVLIALCICDTLIAKAHGECHFNECIVRFQFSPDVRRDMVIADTHVTTRDTLRLDARGFMHGCCPTCHPAMRVLHRLQASPPPPPPPD